MPSRMSTHQARKNSIYSEHPFIFILASYLGGIVIPLPTLSRPGRDYSKKKKETIVSADCLPAPFSKYMKSPRIFSGKRTDRRPVRSHKIRKPSKAHILRLLFTRESFATVFSLSFLRPSMRRPRSSASWQRGRRPARRPCVEAPWPRSPS
jgi:hypothetical protein